MPDFLITSSRSKVWRVWLADCSREHAESALATLEADTSVPSDLKLEQRKLHDLPGAASRRSWKRLWRK